MEDRETGSVVQQATLVREGGRGSKSSARMVGGRSAMAIFGMWVTHKPRLVP